MSGIDKPVAPWIWASTRAFHHTFPGTFTYTDLAVDWEPPSSSQNRARAETGGAAWVDPNNINPLPETTATASVDFLVNGVNCLHGDFTGTVVP